MRQKGCALTLGMVSSICRGMCFLIIYWYNIMAFGMNLVVIHILMVQDPVELPVIIPWLYIKRGLSDLSDWSLITGKIGKFWVRNFLHPQSRQCKTFRTPPFKEWNLFVPPPFNMANTSSYCVKTTPKPFVPPLQHG